MVCNNGINATEENTPERREGIDTITGKREAVRADIIRGGAVEGGGGADDSACPDPPREPGGSPPPVAHGMNQNAEAQGRPHAVKKGKQSVVK
jgi:hypothetical protein